MKRVYNKKRKENLKRLKLLQGAIFYNIYYLMLNVLFKIRRKYYASSFSKSR